MSEEGDFIKIWVVLLALVLFPLTLFVAMLMGLVVMMEGLSNL